MKTLISLLFITVLFFSCEKNLDPGPISGDTYALQTVQSNDINMAEAMAAKSENAAFVYRFEDILRWVFIDFDRGLVAFVGADIYSRCATGDWLTDLVSFQDVVRDEGDEVPRINELIKGDDVKVSVWNFIDVGDCQYINDGGAAVYSGTGDYVFTDNDVSPDGQNQNTWGLRLHGDGITIIYKASFDGENFETFTQSTRILVK